MIKFSTNPRFLKAKLVSYETFNEIANSIKLVAMSKLKKLKQKIETRLVSLGLVKLIFQSFATLESNIETTDASFAKNNKAMIVFLTSDKSCSGSINYPIVRATNDFVDELKSDGSSVSLFSVGRKGYFFLRNKHRKELKRLCYNITQRMSISVSSLLVTNEIMKLEFDTCYILFTRFVNNYKQDVSVYDIPAYDYFYSLIFSDRQPNLVLDTFIKSNSADDMFLKDFYMFSTYLLIVDSFEEILYSELGSKVRTMELAVQNVTETINVLRIKYNNARQAVITNEIIEILNATVAILEK